MNTFKFFRGTYGMGGAFAVASLLFFAQTATAKELCIDELCRVSGSYSYENGTSEISGHQMDEVLFFPDAKSVQYLGQKEGTSIIFRDAAAKKHFLPKGSKGVAELKISNYQRNEEAPELGDYAKLVEAIKVVSAHSAKLAPHRLRGRILLQVEGRGEAWYVRPDVGTRVPMGRPHDAFSLMRSLGVGITNTDMEKIPLALVNLEGSPDVDGDGLSDMAEAALGTDMRNPDTDGDGYSDLEEVKTGYNPLRGYGTRNPVDMNFTRAHAGKIFLAVQRNGEAWYVHPTELKRYYLGRPHDAFEIMRHTGLGITNTDIAGIKEADADGKKTSGDTVADDQAVKSDEKKSKENTPNGYENDKKLAVSTIAKGMYRGRKISVQPFSFQNQEEFDNFWEDIFPNLEKPLVDFSSSFIAIMFGDRGDTSASVDSVTQSGETAATIDASYSGIIGSCPKGLYGAQPYHIVSVAYPTQMKEILAEGWTRAAIGSRSGPNNIPEGKCPDDHDLIALPERTYRNDAYGFSLILPDQLSSFIVERTPEVYRSQSKEYSEVVEKITFSHKSAIGNRNISVLTLDIIEKDMNWTALKERGRFNHSVVRNGIIADTTEEQFIILGETETHAIVKEGSGTQYFEFDELDVAKYGSENFIFTAIL